MKRKIVVILAADAAHYAARMAIDDAATLRQLEEAKALFSKLIASHDGEIFNRAGSALLAEFPSAVEAVRCALAVQAALREGGHGTDGQSALEELGYKIGITIGDVLVRDSDLLGDGVNIAARLMALAPDGGVCVSRNVVEQVGNRVETGFTALGLQRLKNIPEPVAAYVVGAIRVGDASPGGRRAQLALVVAIAAVAGVVAVRAVLTQPQTASVGAAPGGAEDVGGNRGGGLVCKEILERTQLGQLSAADRQTLQKQCQ